MDYISYYFKIIKDYNFFEVIKVGERKNTNNIKKMNELHSLYNLRLS